MESWKTQDLGFVATLQRGYDLPHRDRRPGTVPVVTSSGLGDTHSTAMAAAPGVVTGRYGTIGQVFYLEEPFWPLNTTLFVRNFHGNDPLFVSYLLRTIDFHSHSGKSGVPGVNRNDLHKLAVRLPASLDEQKAISAALSDVDALLGALDRLIAKKRDLKQAAMQQLLTGQTRLPGFSGKWEVKSVRDFARILTGPFGTLLKAEEYLGREGVPLISVGEIGAGVFKIAEQTPRVPEAVTRRLPQYVLNTGDIVFGRKGAVERSALVTEKETGWFLGSDGISIRLRGKEHHPPYVAWQFRRPSVQSWLVQNAIGTTMASLNQGILKRVEIPFAPLAEQCAIADVLSDMDAELTVFAQRRDKTRLLKQGMMQELLTGRTRLV